MACNQKIAMHPEKLRVIIEAFTSDKQTAKNLISKSLGIDDEAGLNAIMKIMNQLSPKTDQQHIFAAQFIIAHTLGLRLMAHNFQKDQRLGMKFLQFSNEAIINL